MVGRGGHRNTCHLRRWGGEGGGLGWTPGHVQAERTYMQIHELTNGHTHTHTRAEGSVSHSNETFRQHLLPFRRPSYLSAASQVVFHRPVPEKSRFYWKSVTGPG